LPPLPLVQILIHNLIVAASSSFTPSPLAFAFSLPLVVPNLRFGSLLLDAAYPALLCLFAASMADFNFRASPSADYDLPYSNGIGVSYPRLSYNSYISV
jgi:hypothetical protein